jgi:hypothetical protein
MKLNCVKGIITLAVLMLPGVMTAYAQNLLKNGNFEIFTGNEPKDWATSNIPKVIVVVSPETRCKGGTYSVKCEVKDFHGSKMAGMISQNGIPVSGSSFELKGFYVLHSVGKDAGFVSIELMDADGNTIKICQENLTNPAANFTHFTMAGDIPRGAVKLDIKMTLLPDKDSDALHEGSYVLFDDLELVPVTPVG